MKKTGGFWNLKRMTGLVLRTWSLSLAALLFSLGDQGRAVSLCLSQLEAIDSLMDFKAGRLRKMMMELIQERPFFDHLNLKLRQAEEELTAKKIPGTVGLFDYGPLLYALVRCVHPSVVVETGVASGASSAYILKAMQAEGKGALYSIDLPEGDKQDPDYTAVQFERHGKFGPTLVPQKFKIGYAVPEELKNRWQLILGDAVVELPKLLEKLSSIDIFFHDSKHSYDHMLFEFQTAYPHLRSGGGLILSDDITWNSSFKDFARQVSKPHTFRPIGILVN